METMNNEEVLLRKFIDRMFEISDNDFTYDRLVQHEDRLDMKELSGQDISDELEWYEVFTWTKAQQEEYRDWLKTQFILEFRFDSDFANEQVEEFMEKYGLTVNG